MVGTDLTADVMRVRVEGRRLSDEEIVSVLRNWTGGDLGSIALCVGVLLRGTVTNDALQRRLRGGVSEAECDAIIDELRRDDPFVSNRRVDLPSLAWRGRPARRDARHAGRRPTATRPSSRIPASSIRRRTPKRTLVYGIGRHACPGRTLATLELRVALQALLAGTTWIAAADEEPLREIYPVGVGLGCRWSWRRGASAAGRG